MSPTRRPPRSSARNAARPDGRPAVDQAPSRPEPDSQEFRHIPESPAPRCSRLNSCERDLMPETSTTLRTVLRSALALICATAAAGCGGGSPSSATSPKPVLTVAQPAPSHIPALTTTAGLLLPIEAYLVPPEEYTQM